MVFLEVVLLIVFKNIIYLLKWGIRFEMWGLSFLCVFGYKIFMYCCRGVYIGRNWELYYLCMVLLNFFVKEINKVWENYFVFGILVIFNIGWLKIFMIRIMFLILEF